MTQTIAPAQELWISVARAARILQKSPSQVRRYVEEGKLRARRVGALGWQSVAYDDVLKLITAGDLEK